MKFKICDDDLGVEISFVHRSKANYPNLLVGETTSAHVTLFKAPGYLEKWSGTACVHPDDQYCKRIGRRIALTKALVGVDRETRRAIWNGLIQMGVRFF